MADSVCVIPLTHGFVAIIDAADHPKIAPYRWSAHWSGHRWYAARQYHDEAGRHHRLYMHRMILDAGQREQVDHENGDGLDNRRSNIRIATQSQNNANVGKRKHNTSGFKGVWRNPRDRIRPWYAKVGSHHLGCFATPEEAARAYDGVARERFGEFAQVNFLGTSPRPAQEPTDGD